MQPTKKKTKERSHSIANTKKVAVAVAKNPTGTLREIAKEAWVSHETVNNKLWQIWQLKEKWLTDLLSVDIDIIKSATTEIKRRINDEDEKKQIKATDLSTIAQHSADRYMKFKGTVTDESGWLKDIDWDNTPIADLIKIIKAK